VLIADDQRSTRRGLKALLGLFPEVEVVGEAADGGESVELVENCLPDVVLMDVRMPGMDGLTAARLIKRQWPGVAVVVSSMYPSYQQDAFAAGADAFLLKGCQPELLRDTIDRFGKPR
jgi:DNA-binding NarL/FixJ family response regulator